MAKLYTCIFLIYAILPMSLLLSISLRPFGISAIYLIFYLAMPLQGMPKVSPKQQAGKIILLCILFSTILIGLHIVWHIVLLSMPPYGSVLDEYPFLRTLGENLGLVSYKTINPWVGIFYVLPELIVLSVSMMIYSALRKLLSEPYKLKRKKEYVVTAGKYTVIMLLLTCGVLKPNAISAMYYVVFLCILMAWANGSELTTDFAKVIKFIMVYMAVHLWILFIYQNTWVMELIPPGEKWSRYFGLCKVVDNEVYRNATSYSEFKERYYEGASWTVYPKLLTLLITYYIIALLVKELSKPRLVRSMSSRNRSFSARESVGTYTAEDGNVSSSGSFLSEILMAIQDLVQVLKRVSYIAACIAMMAWSIMFHSWLTFVLLIWANIVWLYHDQRSFMLKSSPFLVIYSTMLLVIGYVYGLDLTEDELPSNLTGINLQQIGLGRTEGEPFTSLFIKSLFTILFYATLRRYLRDKRRLSVSVETISYSDQRVGGEPQSRITVVVSKWLKSFCTRYWMCVVVMMLFIIGIHGDRMTIFRILYMALFFQFVLLFQISWYWWRRLMYMFWITIIIYSMVVLILIYVYQFDHCQEIIHSYLLINPKLQKDLGLEYYHPTDLFVKLLTPTLCLIISVIQVHYFHEEFMKLSEHSKKISETASKSSHDAEDTMKDELPALPIEQDLNDSQSIKSMKRNQLEEKPSTQARYSMQTSRSSAQFRHIATGLYLNAAKYVDDKKEIVFLILELHLGKVVLVALMLLCTLNLCAIHIPLMLISVLGLMFKTNKQRNFFLTCSFLISLYFMANMVYQIEYISHSYFDVNCTQTRENITTTLNDATWFGFEKKSPQRSLARILIGYTGLILIFNVYAIIYYRQEWKRASLRIPEIGNRTPFPEIHRKEADANLNNLIKYLINHGFYKFGIEITLVCLVGVIGSRMDAYALVYALWLLLLTGANRARKARLWPAFTFTVILLLLIQYMIAVGSLPSLCATYYWSSESERMKHLRSWAFLPYPESPPHGTKLIFDYFLLLFCTRQIRVFKTEKLYPHNYCGGSNSKNIGKHYETPEFVNPVPDFTCVVGTWLDVMKRVIFLSMLWITLAIMFLAGTNRVNLFSIGYLIGSYVFLWQGTDFYLRPKECILRWWLRLIYYNVWVIALKTLFQLPGCIFLEEMQTNVCWMVQLLGIGCVDKFAGGIHQFIKMDILPNKSACSVPQEHIGLAWDGVCFFFLIMQKRLFESYYFYRIIDDSKAATILATRGAELIEEQRQNQMKQQEEHELKILEKIKQKMDKIKATQQRVKGILVKTPITHAKAVRSGDYYMFEEYDDTEINLEQKSSSEGEDEDEPPKDVGLGIGRKRSTTTTAGESEILIKQEPEKPETQEQKESDIVDVKYEETFIDKIHHYLDVIWAFTISAIVTTTRYLMRFSRDYRYVSKILSIEKRALKESKGFGVGRRDNPNMIWQPISVDKSVVPNNFSALQEQEDIMFPADKTSFAHFTYSIWYTLLAHTDILCYLMVFLNQIQSATLLSIPLPLLVFFWGTLSIPRPTKTFWITLIAYTEVIVLVKTMFQFEVLPWNQEEPLANAINYTKIIGIERKSNYALYDLLLLLIIFLHRSMLKTLGLWNESPEDEEAENAIDDSDSDNAKSKGPLDQKQELPLQIIQPSSGTNSQPEKEKRGPRISFASDDDKLAEVQKKLGIDRTEKRKDEGVSDLPSTSYGQMEGESSRTLDRPHDVKGLETGTSSDTESETEAPRKDEENPKPETSKEKDPKTPIVLFEKETAKKQSDETSPPVTLEPLPPARKEEGHPSQPAEDDPVRQETVTKDQKAERATLDLSSEAKSSRQSDDDDDYRDETVNEEESPQKKYFSDFVRRYFKPMRMFLKRMQDHGSRVTADVYAYMFFCDFINFLVVIFGFAAFGTHQGDGGVQAYLEENKVPIPFLLMLILQFGLIVIDRALYLRKYILGKIILQYGLIVGVHIWMFFVLPFITERQFNELLPPPLWYMIKCIYLLLSAYQIRCGYPRRIIGNFLCKAYSYVNLLSFRGFMALPFIFELRTMMDWIWTDTSMTLLDWLKMEDIFASIFILKCSRHIEDDWPMQRGIQKQNTSKYVLGGSVLAFVIAIIWFPLVFFALGNSVGIGNPPTDVTVKIRIGPYLPIYQMSAQSDNIRRFDAGDYARLSDLYARNREAQTFLSYYLPDDVAVVTFKSNSAMTWDISPPELKQLESKTESNVTLPVKFTFVLTHPSTSAQNPPTIEESQEAYIHPFDDDKKLNPNMESLINLLSNASKPDEWVTVNGLFPKFVKVNNKGTARPIHQLSGNYYRNVQMRLEYNPTVKYWRVREYCTNETNSVLPYIPHNNCDNLVMYTFNDRLFPETLNIISGSGIIGLYTTFVFLASRVLRGFFSGIYTKIMFDDLPNVDRILQLCFDIYLVREALELTLEEDLFAKLVFLYRSPETMIKWTRPKEPEQLALPEPQVTQQQN